MLFIYEACYGTIESPKKFHFKLFLYSESAFHLHFIFLKLLVVSKSCSFSAQIFFSNKSKRYYIKVWVFSNFLINQISLCQICYKGLLFVLSSEMHGLYTYGGKGETLLSKLNILKKHVEQKAQLLFLLALLLGTSILTTYTCQK